MDCSNDSIPHLGAAIGANGLPVLKRRPAQAGGTPGRHAGAAWNLMRTFVSPSGAVPCEITFSALAQAAGQGAGSNVFRVEAAGQGSLEKWNGSEWVRPVAGGTLVGLGEKLRWVPACAGCTSSALIVQSLPAVAVSPVRAAAPDKVFVLTLPQGGWAEGVFARDEGAPHRHVATALLESREELRRMSALLVSIQEDERRRIALDLHDGLGQSLSHIKLSLENCATLLAEGACQAAGESLQRLIPRVRDALSDVRRVSAELRPLILDDLGMLPTLSWFLREFRSVAGDVQVDAQLSVSEQDVPASLHITIFRIVQEAFHNILKHAAAAQVRVQLERAGATLQLRIEDDGRGFDPQAMPPAGTQARGLGLLSMKERAELTGGTYQLRSAAGRGTSIHVAWACKAPE